MTSSFDRIRFGLGRNVLILAICLAPLQFGSSTTGTGAILLALASVALLLAPPIRPRLWRQLWPILICFGLCLLYAALQLPPSAHLMTAPRAPLSLPWLPITINPSRFVDSILGMLLVVVALLAAISHGQDRNHAYRLVFAFLLTAAATVVFALVLHVLDPSSVLGRPKVSYQRVFTGTFFNRGATGGWLCLLIVAALALLARTIARSVRDSVPEGLGPLHRFLAIVLDEAGMIVLLLAVTAITTIALLLTQSRAALFALMLCLAVFIIVLARSGALNARALAAVTVTLIAGASLVFVYAGSQVDQRLGSVNLLDDGRFDIWRVSLAVISERPWTGFGAGTFTDIFPLFRDQPLSNFGEIRSAHSIALQFAAEYGVPLTLLMAGLCLYLVGSIAVRALQPGYLDAIRVLGLLAAITLLALCMVDVSYLVFGFVFPGIVLVGIALGVQRHAVDDDCQEPVG